MNKVTIPYNDVFFYGISLRSRDVSDVKGDVFANILKKYLMSLKPVSNKLYRSANNSKYEYSYSFIPSKPLSWRVIKNRRIIEDIEQLSDGKYCLNYYDDHGNDVKRIIFNSRNKWVKTNYYNSIYGNNVLCSLVPKEQNGETIILQYETGVTYPTTLRCCTVASCSEVLDNVLERVPEPEVMALTNYGLLYFACDETRNIYEQILKEEEEKYIEAHKPAVYNTEEDVANGFCFDAESFDTTKNSSSLFDLNMADELTEDGFSVSSEDYDETPEQPVLNNMTKSEDDISIPDLAESPEDEVYSIDEQIAAAIKLISETTNITIDEKFVLSDSASDKDASSVIDESFELLKESSETETIDEVVVSETVDDIVIPPNRENAPDDSFVDELSSPVPYDANDLLSMNDAAIDDYVSTLIDTLLLDAHASADELVDTNKEVFVSADTEISTHNDDLDIKSSSQFVEETNPDVTIESNGVSYFYYGDIDDNGMRSGRGKTLMADGKTAYEGEYLDDARHGKGAFYYKDGGLCYWGDWNKNLRHGLGLGISSETGIVHVGKWSHNKPCGVGVRYDSDGKFLYIDSACDKTNGGIRITEFTENSFTVEIWNEKTLKFIKKVITLDDLQNN